jgi:hypothetical protein
MSCWAPSLRNVFLAIRCGQRCAVWFGKVLRERIAQCHARISYYPIHDMWVYSLARIYLVGTLACMKAFVQKICGKPNRKFHSRWRTLMLREVHPLSFQTMTWPTLP